MTEQITGHQENVVTMKTTKKGGDEGGSQDVMASCASAPMGIDHGFFLKTICY
jgi:hypothetical protein